MVKAKAHPDQLGFAFEAPLPAQGEAALAGMEQRVCRMVGSILASDGRAREVIAAQMSVLLGEEVSRAMLDAYSSPARLEHKVPFSRLMALVAVTGRHDLLDPLMREIGAALLVGEEVHTARLGHIDRQIAQLQAEKKRIAGSAPLIRSGGM
ncbi:MAG: hypothetical protein VYD90_13055 [Pseudomonadota bacterium]|uniref:hypothetical protein n=1 Tax=Novosphingobium sp. MBES04 TaxID=1206458 RepID=UPI0006948ADC|nr:hypothetical protein [Novosphingobium sp. MBES04]MED5546171.1 hypothetical protein [Pseudomonadota bacterium]GAM04835.1 hypothetical conserved protein [Novosphingobium sp. MBES04]